MGRSEREKPEGGKSSELIYPRFNPDAFEYVPSGKSDKAGSESVFQFNPTASEFVSLSSNPSHVDVDNGKLFVEEDSNSTTNVNENGNDTWYFFNPPTLEYVPLNSENGMPSGSFDDGVEDGYGPSFWNEKASESQLVFNPEASEFVPSYKDSSSENDREQQFVHLNYYEDQQDLIQPVYPGSDQQLVYYEYPENYPVHSMIPTTDQCLLHHTMYPINDAPYNMVSWQSQQSSYFRKESNQIGDWSTGNINPDPRTTFSHEMYSDNNAGFMKNEPLPQGEEYYYSDTVPVHNSQSAQLPSPFPQKPTTPENTPVTLTPLYALIGVQPNSHRSKRHVKPAIRRMMPIPRRGFPVESNLGNQSTYCQQSVASSVQPYHVMEPLPFPTQSQAQDISVSNTPAPSALKPFYKKFGKDFQREMVRASKKKQIAKPQIAPKETLIKLNEQQAAPRGSISLGRSMGSFSSTMSLYQNHPKHKSQKSMGYFKRASQSSFSGSMDGDQLIVTTPSSATLPRNGNPFFPPMKLSPVDSTNEGTTSQESLIPLTQVLISQRTPRSHAEQRKSQSWTATGENRSSIISVGSLEFPRQNNSYPSEPGSRTSVTSPESGIDGEAESSDETAPPPVPPKQRDKHSDNKPPTPPPKPPMRFFRDVPQL